MDMEWIDRIWQQLTGLSGMFWLPVGVCIIGLLLKLKFAKALKSGMLISIGFLGINMLALFVCDAMAPAMEVFSANGSYTVVDIGWQALASSAWVMPFSLIIVVGGYVLNVWLIRKGITRTLNTDVWDYCHILFCSAITYVVFDSVLLAIVIGILGLVITVKGGDLIAKRWEEHLEYEGTTGSIIFHVTTMFPVYYLCDWIIERIPGLNKVDISFDKAVRKFSVIADPIFIGFLTGLGIGLAARLALKQTLYLAFAIAMFMLLAGRIVSVITEGISPLSAAAKQLAMQKIGDNPDLLIGMDFSLGQGDPGAINASVILIPITVVLALVLPGVSFFPTSLVPNLIVYTCVGSLACKGNTFRVVIGSVVLIVAMLYAQTWMVPLTTEMVAIAGIETSLQITGGSSASILAVIIAAIGKLLGTW